MNAWNWAALMLAIVAVAVFAFSVWLWRRDEFRRGLEDWRRLVVYSCIENSKSISFEDIQSNFAKKAQELYCNKFPESEIQGSTLKCVLLDLKQKNLVFQQEDLKYRDANSALVVAINSQVESAIRVEVLTILERESGIHTEETLFEQLRNQEIDGTFQQLKKVIWDLRDFGKIRKGEDGKLEFVVRSF